MYGSNNVQTNRSGRIFDWNLWMNSISTSINLYTTLHTIAFIIKAAAVFVLAVSLLSFHIDPLDDFNTFLWWRTIYPILGILTLIFTYYAIYHNLSSGIYVAHWVFLGIYTVGLLLDLLWVAIQDLPCCYDALCVDADYCKVGGTEPHYSYWMWLISSGVIFICSIALIALMQLLEKKVSLLKIQISGSDVNQLLKDGYRASAAADSGFPIMGQGYSTNSLSLKRGRAKPKISYVNSELPTEDLFHPKHTVNTDIEGSVDNSTPMSIGAHIYNPYMQTVIKLGMPHIGMGHRLNIIENELLQYIAYCYDIDTKDAETKKTSSNSHNTNLYTPGTGNNKSELDYKPHGTTMIKYGIKKNKNKNKKN